MVVSCTAVTVPVADCRALVAVPSRPVALRTAMAGAAVAAVHVLVEGVHRPAVAEPPLPLPPKRPPAGDRRCWRSDAAAEAADSRTEAESLTLAWVPAEADRVCSAAGADD